MRNFDDLSEREMLALAISNEEEDSRIYADFADGSRGLPGERQCVHRHGGRGKRAPPPADRPFRAKFGEHIPLIRRQDVRGFIQHKPVWQMRPLSLDAVRAHADEMERAAAPLLPPGARARHRRRHPQAARRPRRGRGHARTGGRTGAGGLTAERARSGGGVERRRFVLRIIQPGLAGLMDGSVSTLAPVFAAAFATRNSWDAFLVGMAASIGAGISMGFAEALSDNGSLTGRGAPCCAARLRPDDHLGGIGHTLPFLIPIFYTATAWPSSW